MERHRHIRWTLLTSALVLGAGLASAPAAWAVGYASFNRGVAMRATRPTRPTVRSRGGVRQSASSAPSDGTPGNARNARGATGGDAMLAQHQDGRERRRAPDSRVILDPFRARSCRPRSISVAQGEQIVSGSGAVFHDAHAPPASIIDAAGRRS